MKKIGENDPGMTRIEESITKLLAESEIRDVIFRYCRGVDRKDFALVRSAFHDDATLDYSPFFKGDVNQFLERG